MRKDWVKLYYVRLKYYYGSWENENIYVYDRVHVYISILYLCIIIPVLLAIMEVAASGQSYLDGTFMGDIDLYPRI